MNPATAAVIRSTNEPFALQEIEVDNPRTDEVLVRIVATGMCHTDLGARAGKIPFPLPGVLGHEAAGIIEDAGDGVTDVALGDHVVISFAYCGHCKQCRTGHPAYCDHWGPLNLSGGSRPDGTPTLYGDAGTLHGHFFGQSSFATRALAPANSVVRVPDDAPLELLGPLACGIQTGAQSVLNVLRPEAGETLAIFGAGGVGLAAVIAAVNLTGSRVVVVDINPSRLDLAKELGAHETINGRETDAVAALFDLTGGRGADTTLEATGVPPVLDQAIRSLAPMGRCGVVGAPPPTVDGTFNVLDSIVKGKRIIGINQGDAVPRDSIPALTELYQEGRFPFDRLVRFYRFEDIEQAAADAQDGSTIKPVLRMPDN